LDSSDGGIAAGRELEVEELERLWLLRDPCDALQSSGDSSREGEFGREGGLGDLWFPLECSSSFNFNYSKSD